MTRRPNPWIIGLALIALGWAQVFGIFAVTSVIAAVWRRSASTIIATGITVRPAIMMTQRYTPAGMSMSMATRFPVRRTITNR